MVEWKEYKNQFKPCATEAYGHWKVDIVLLVHLVVRSISSLSKKNIFIPLKLILFGKSKCCCFYSGFMVHHPIHATATYETHFCFFALVVFQVIDFSFGQNILSHLLREHWIFNPLMNSWCNFTSRIVSYKLHNVLKSHLIAYLWGKVF